MIEGRLAPNYVVWDLETGGFSPDKNPLVEVCMICYDGVTLEEIDRYEALIKPYYENPVTKEVMEYTDAAMATHGISISELEEDGIEIKEVLREILQRLKDWKTKGFFGAPILVGHNILKFDIPFLVGCYRLFSKEEYFWKAISRQIYDTMLFSMLRFFTSKDKGDETAPNTNHKLGSICKAVGVSLIGAHRASADTEANAEMFFKFVRAMRGEGMKGVSGEIENKTGSMAFKF